MREKEEQEKQERDSDHISDGGVPAYEISKEAKEQLEREDRNFLMKHKTHEQLEAEDPDNQEIWGYDS